LLRFVVDDGDEDWLIMSRSLVCFSNSGILDLKSPGWTLHQNRF
jgi:hypothetical protein